MTIQAAPIPEVSGVDRERFEREIVPASRPVVMRGLVAGWPAARLGRQSPEAICRYLAERDTGAPIDAIMLPPEEKGRIFYNAAMDGFNFFRSRQPVARVIEQIARYSAFASAPAVAAQSAVIRSCLPRFLDDNPMPLLDAVEPRIWIGNAITVPAHFDDANNIACVVAGRRRFTLFPPDQIGNLYIGPIDFAPTGAPISLVDFAAPDLERFPRFAEARAHAFGAELGPGDAIFIPPLWWHHVQSLELCNILVNYWWGASHEDNAGLDCLTHALITLRQLPEQQRAAWAALFDHYVFGDRGQAVAHIPDNRRGMLGSLGTDFIRERRAQLAAKLGAK
ncbi:MAG TPA: cupin-like domain-containing protein [Rudaea sp.]|nr:cupin-like domain-containing protein [Rudaea sp.]